MAGDRANLVLLTYDSCRYDVLRAANTPVLDSFADVLLAEAPANFTYPSHLAMFAGILPNCDEPRPYYNRFCGQLFGLAGVGELQVANRSSLSVISTWNAVAGLSEAGFQTVGAGAMNWFLQESLTSCFQQFRFTGTDADAQIDYVLDSLDFDRPFFAFINFGETHAPFVYKGKTVPCPVDVRARVMQWPPRQGLQPVGRASEAFSHQVAAAEYLDTRLPRVLSAFPADTVVVLCADHGECFGEDGFWGHGVNHPMVLQVPLAIFRLDGGSVRLT
jgi:membrane-anchored protein YejM (alkaline phosphatase superfamily)